MKYVYSIDEENYYEDIQVIQSALKSLDHKHGDTVLIERGEKYTLTHRDFVHYDLIRKLSQDIIDEAQQQGGEYAEEYDFEFEHESADKIIRTIINEIEKYIAPPEFWKAINVHGFKITTDFSTINPETFEAIT